MARVNMTTPVAFSAKASGGSIERGSWRVRKSNWERSMEQLVHGDRLGALGFDFPELE